MILKSPDTFRKITMMIRISIFTLALHLSCIMPLWSQELYPDRSYDATIFEKAGFTHFKITYGRPLQRGRDLFGAFIPYGKVWRAGANGTTTISFDTPVHVQGTKVQPGTYALITVPGKDEWEIILHRDTTMFTDRKDYLASDEVAHFTVKADKAQHHQEAFTIFTDIHNNDLVVHLVWDFTRVSFVLETQATAIAMNALRKRMKDRQLKTAEDLVYAADFLAYNYSYLDPQVRDTALLLVEKAIALDPQESWSYRVKRDIFWFSKDLDGIEKATREWIAFYQSRKAEGYLEDIRVLEDELVWFRKTMEKK